MIGRNPPPRFGLEQAADSAQDLQLEVRGPYAQDVGGKPKVDDFEDHTRGEGELLILGEGELRVSAAVGGETTA